MVETGESAKYGALDTDNISGLLEHFLFRRLLKKVQVQGGARSAD
jgi:hypothetical protein